MAAPDIIHSFEKWSCIDSDLPDKYLKNIIDDLANDFRAKGTTIFMSCHEDWLVKAISNKVYAFSNGSMIRKVDNNKAYYILSFYNSNNMSIVRGMVKCGKYAESISELLFVAVLRLLLWHLILYVFRYFSRKWQKISYCECPDLIQNETPVRFLYGTQKNVRSDRTESSWHSN